MALREFEKALTANDGERMADWMEEANGSVATLTDYVYGLGE
jgi:hypothetical protein